jgi:hypothetical protein
MRLRRLTGDEPTDFMPVCKGSIAPTSHAHSPLTQAPSPTQAQSTHKQRANLKEHQDSRIEWAYVHQGHIAVFSFLEMNFVFMSQRRLLIDRNATWSASAASHPPGAPLAAAVAATGMELPGLSRMRSGTSAFAEAAALTLPALNLPPYPAASLSITALPACHAAGHPCRMALDTPCTAPAFLQRRNGPARLIGGVHLIHHVAALGRHEDDVAQDKVGGEGEGGAGQDDGKEDGGGSLLKSPPQT